MVKRDCKNEKKKIKTVEMIEMQTFNIIKVCDCSLP